MAEPFFFDPKTQRPLLDIQVAQGETKVVGIQKFEDKDVAVYTGDSEIAFANKVLHLKDPSKRSYDSNYDYNKVLNDSATFEQKGSIFFQVCGNHKGLTALMARFKSDPNGPPYAMSIGITVTENKKQLTFNPSKPLDVLWSNHPYNPMREVEYQVKLPNGLLIDTKSHPCYKATWLVGQCMIRFCTMLDKSGVGMTGMHGNRCGFQGKPHDHHFINPYDFEAWKSTKDAYVWEAKPPYEIEPMPGVAAHQFTHGKRGVIMFKNYFPTSKAKGDMGGGHIDLWNKDRMGNNFSMPNPDEGLSAFVRSRKIVFWPLEPI